MSKALELQQLSKKSNLKGVWGKLEAINCFQRQTLTKYLKQTLVFKWKSAPREKFNFCFTGNFTSNDRIFISGGWLSTRQYFYEVLRFPWYFLILENPKSKVVRQHMKQLMYTSLLLIITLRFSCDERKTFSTITKSQNIMNMTAG